MASGRKRVRRRFRNVPYEVSVQWRLSDEQAAVFIGWVEHALNGGVAEFKLNIKTPLGIKEVDTQFLSHPLEDVKRKGDKWIYKAKLKMKELPILSEDQTANAILSPYTSEELIHGVSVAIRSYQE
ncbi:hypothetical protein [Shewanella surugensis]|uniref:Uncharacterized protein n=1 Tax=Shewanella surugensis TaxID=212020 RepID=A0ABT0L967_9GAMM|nr:hypothetical protein [Shewanella surugensis]MCL1124241.1 hypothetical protein [Shewanella surugensis]